MHQEEVHAPLPCTFSYLIPVPHPPAGYVLHHPDQALPLSPDEEETPQYVGSDLPYSHCIPSHWKKAWYTPATEVDSPLHTLYTEEKLQALLSPGVCSLPAADPDSSVQPYTTEGFLHSVCLTQE